MNPFLQYFQRYIDLRNKLPKETILPEIRKQLLIRCLIEVGQDLKIRVNGHTNELRPAENYKDAISLAIIFASPSFPKSKADISDPEFRNSRFYLTTSEETSNFNKSKIQKTRKANIEMAKLFEESKNKNISFNGGYIGFISYDFSLCCSYLSD